MAAIDDSFVETLFAELDSNRDLYISELAHAVSIKSVSSNLDEHLLDIQAMLQWTKDYIEKLGGQAQLVDNPANKAGGQIYPPLLLGDFSSVTSSSSSSTDDKKTVCVYGHLDVQPADISDGWHSDPFTLTERDGKLYGRGSTDDKGPALSWLWVIAAYQKIGRELPVNIKLLFEGMEESGSVGIFEWINSDAAKVDGFLNNIDFFCISDNVSKMHE